MTYVFSTIAGEKCRRVKAESAKVWRGIYSRSVMVKALRPCAKTGAISCALGQRSPYSYSRFRHCCGVKKGIELRKRPIDFYLMLNGWNWFYMTLLNLAPCFDAST
jgi:hypothetical protein